MSYFFVIKGSVIKGDDGRTAILMTSGERNHVLGEMRGFLEAVQAITEGIANDDMALVATSANAVGMALVRNESPALLAKMPIEFKKLGFGAHTAFDDMAQEATDIGDGKMLTAQLGDLLGRCTGCHAGYRFDIESN
ncbi:MAG: hypothetical protein Q9M48_06005 [Rhodobacterales bacterium]|nr:hypothetical protein [Rhodobacterales bacterium]